MSNQEQLKTIQKVRNARDAIGLAQIERDLAPSQRSNLDELYLHLDNIEGQLILEDIREKIDGLSTTTLNLEQIIERMQKSTESLEGVAQKVKLAAEAIKRLIDILPA